MRGAMPAASNRPAELLHSGEVLLIARAAIASAPLPKFVIHRSTLWHELRKQRGTSKSMVLVPLFDLKFLTEFAAAAVGTSNRRHETRAGVMAKSKPPHSETPSLTELRREIDRIDEAMHRLLMERGDIIK